ncbi:MAG: response regulator [Acidobacteria bacterium]|nr:MAG: response regulator [Acidobacteriota bacterium]
MDFTKIEAGKIELDPIEVSPRTLIDNAIKVVGVKAEAKGLGLVAKIDPACPAWVRVDSVRLRQILLNLIGNAIKFTADGEVRVLASVDGETDSHVTIRFEVIDSGIGTPLDRQDKLFESFSQADTSTTCKYGGSGLGLTISKQLCGLLSVESEPRQGSNFYFSHLIFMDCQMPTMDGLEATRRIRAAATERHLPIIALTASAMAGDRERCLAVGMDDFLSKPVRQEELTAILDRWLPAETGVRIAHTA